MASFDINWSEYIRDAVRAKIAEERRRRAGEALLASLEKGEHRVPEGFINEAVREGREAR